jgi:hypothetical protein
LGIRVLPLVTKNREITKYSDLPQLYFLLLSIAYNWLPGCTYQQAKEEELKGGAFNMRNLVQKLFFGSVVTAALFVLSYTIWVYAHWQIDGLQALLCVGMSLLAILCFGFLLNDEMEDWPLSIRDTGRAVTPLRERRSEWKLSEQKAA